MGAAALALASCSGDLSPPRVLIETRVAVGDSTRHEVKVDAPPDAAVLVTIAGRGVDVRGAVGAPTERIAGFADAPNRRMGVETLLIEAGHAGTLAIAVERNDHPAAHGHADVTVAILPQATESDRRRLEAARLEAQACLDFPVLERGAAGADAFAKAARLHARNGARLQEGMSLLQAAGARYARLADWPGAAALAADAETLLTRAWAPEYAAYALRLEGAALDQRANASGVAAAERARDLARARERLTEAAERFKALGNDYEAGYALNYRGVSYDVAGDRLSARRDFLAALGLFRKAGDSSAQALSLQSLALQSHQDGRLADAMREFDHALSLIPREEDPENYAHTLHNSAWPLRVLGRFDEAVLRFAEAGEILHIRGDRDGEARALHGMATTLMHAGEPKRAAELLEVAVRLRGETGSRREQAVSLNVLGQLEQDFGQFDRAIAIHLQALALASAPHDVAQVRLALAKAKIAVGRRAEARSQLNELLRLDLPQSHRYRGLALSELGALEALEGRSAKSLDYFSRAIEVARLNGADLDYALILVRRAEAQLLTGNPEGAIADARVAVDRLDSIGLESLQAESRAVFRASYRHAIEVQIAALLEVARPADARTAGARAQGILRRALNLSDEARAQLLADPEFASAGVAANELIASRRKAFELLAGKRQQRDRLMNSGAPDENRIAELTLEINRLRAEVSAIESEMASNAANPRSAPRSSGTHRTSEFIPKDVVVAEFFIGRSHAWLFEVRDGETKVHDLGEAQTIESLTRRLNREWREYTRAPADRFKQSRELSTLLFGTMAPLDPGDSLVVIPDGPLHVVPIATLARQAVQIGQDKPVRIAMTLASLTNGQPTAGHRASTLIAVIADPIYTVDDPRIQGTGPTVSSHLSAMMLTRSAQNLTHMRRLPSTAVESSSIVALVDDGQALELTGANANRRSLTSARLERYRIIHFATHAFADSEDPALASLALSQFDQSGQPLDGYLRSFDIAELRLNADLVVLSACNTAIGREIAGEAPLGLAQAFLRGGARSVLATLWQVPDTSTARLMEEFYRQMLVEQRPAALALELAQKHIREQPHWSDPYFWAGFQLTSNARFDVGN